MAKELTVLEQIAAIDTEATKKKEKLKSTAEAAINSATETLKSLISVFPDAVNIALRNAGLSVKATRASATAGGTRTRIGKAEVVAALTALGTIKGTFSRSELAEKLTVAPNSVNNILKKFKDGGGEYEMIKGNGPANTRHKIG